MVWEVPTLAEWLAAAPEQRRWLIADLLPENSLIVVSGQQKFTHKTWFADLIALCISTGTTHGPLRSENPGSVLYVQDEGSSAGTRGRLLALCKMIDRAPPSLTNIWFSHREGVKLDIAEWRDRLVAKVQEHKCRLVIFDSLTFLHVGDENSNADMSVVVDTMKSLRAQDASVMVLVHLDKARGGRAKADADAQIRGGSILSGAYDTHLAFRRNSAENPSISLEVRHRESEWTYHRLQWTVAAGEGNVPLVSLAWQKIIQEEPKAKPAKATKPAVPAPVRVPIANADLEVKYTRLEIGKSYSLRGLQNTWECGYQHTKTIVDCLIADGRMVHDGRAYKVRGEEI